LRYIKDKPVFENLQKWYKIWWKFVPPIKRSDSTSTIIVTKNNEDFFSLMNINKFFKQTYKKINNNCFSNPKIDNKKPINNSEYFGKKNDSGNYWYWFEIWFCPSRIVIFGKLGKKVLKYSKLILFLNSWLVCGKDVFKILVNIEVNNISPWSKCVTCICIFTSLCFVYVMCLLINSFRMILSPKHNT
jgi:hypothetical protein